MILDEDGLPLAGAHIDVLPEQDRGRQTEEGHFVSEGQPRYMVTDATGEFSTEVPPSFWLMVRARGHAVYNQEMEVPTGTQKQVTIALLPGRRVSGQTSPTKPPLNYFDLFDNTGIPHWRGVRGLLTPLIEHINNEPISRGFW